MSYRKFTLKGQAGFTIAEVLIASLIIAFSFAFIYLLVTTTKEKSAERNRDSALLLTAMTTMHSITKEIRYVTDKVETMPDGRTFFYSGEEKWCFRFDENSDCLYRDVYINDTLAHSFFVSDKVDEFAINISPERKGLARIILKIGNNKANIFLNTSISVPKN